MKKAQIIITASLIIASACATGGSQTAQSLAATTPDVGSSARLYDQSCGIYCEEPSSGLLVEYLDLWSAAVDLMGQPDAKPPAFFVHSDLEDTVLGRHYSMGDAEIIVINADILPYGELRKAIILHEILHALQEGEGHPEALFGAGYDTESTVDHMVSGDHTLAVLVRKEVTSDKDLLQQQIFHLAYSTMLETALD